MSESEQTVTDNKDALIEIANQLHTAREEKDLSVSEVANNLHLDGSIIEKLESGDFEQLTSLTYVAGYIRSYAKLLKLPVDDILAKLYETNEDSPAIVPTYLQGKSIRIHKSSNRKVLAVIIMVVLMLLVTTWWVIRNAGAFEIPVLSPAKTDNIDQVKQIQL